MTTRQHALVPFLCLLAFACRARQDAQEPAPAQPAAKPPPAVAAPVAPESAGPRGPAKAAAPASAAPGSGELVFTPPAGWVVEKPASGMRKAQYTLPRAEGDSEDASLVVYYFGTGGGGGREANPRALGGAVRAARRGRFRVADQERRPHRERSRGHGRRALRHLRRRDEPGLGRARAQGRLAHAGLDRRDAEGPYYLKLVGPEKTLARWEASYKGFVDGLKTAP
jgi:hypothetical protein